jgi:hypothetical protein
MRNQPEAIGRMIRRRRAARERRQDKNAYAMECLRDIQSERTFERFLQSYGIEPVFEDIASWGKQFSNNSLTVPYSNLNRDTSPGLDQRLDSLL